MSTKPKLENKREGEGIIKVWDANNPFFYGKSKSKSFSKIDTGIFFSFRIIIKNKDPNFECIWMG